MNPSLGYNTTGLAGVTSWQEIPWKLVNREVTKLKMRVFTASRGKSFRKLRGIQRLILSSNYVLLQSIRRVTQVNRGKITPGQDSITYLSPEERWNLFLELSSLDLSQYQPTPVKRIYVPKPNGKLRPIGLPTLKDRVIQCIFRHSLEPEWEARFENSSYGFRPSRSYNDAINRVFLSLNKENCRSWVVEADIKSCFDTISHDYLLNKLHHFPHLDIIKRWLKGGILEENVFFNTDEGTPQGSLISPLLMNITLHGLSDELGIRVDNRGSTISGYRLGYDESRSFIRYADDFIVLCYTQSDAIKVRNLLIPLLQARGLTLSEDKTRITHITEGFDFLGFNIRVCPLDGYSRDQVIRKANPVLVKHRSGKPTYIDKGIDYDFNKTLILIRPSAKSVSKFKDAIKAIFLSNRGSNADKLIKELNPVIRGWALSKYHWHANRTFHALDHYIYNLCWRWMIRAHPNKSNAWRKQRYFRYKREYGIDNRWVFHSSRNGKNIDLLQLKWFRVSRHVMIDSLANPFDKRYKAYFDSLVSQRLSAQRAQGFRSVDVRIMEKQKLTCPVCGDSLFNGEDLHRHHIVPKSIGGKDSPGNLVFLHVPCHYQVHSKGKGYKWLQQKLKQPNWYSDPAPEIFEGDMGETIDPQGGSL